ncbi:MAG: cysteine synthase A [Alphaproteobacteria bacterium]|nr:cysteine synthase A [Alphaproteobacteria bacterium]
MAEIYNSITELVGHTPLLRLGNLMTKLRLKAEIVAKCEMYNPLFSVKDRIALAMLEKAEKEGINKDTIFVEATSGNTGIALCAMCAAKGYKIIIVMPENMSQERISLMKHLGAEVILTPAEDGMSGAIHKAEMLKERDPNVVILSQFNNEANPMAHRLGTAMEILEDSGGEFDAFVAGVGTSGTLTGTASVLRTYNPDLFVAAVEPLSSAVLSGEAKGKHQIQGIGAGFVPPFYDKDLVDEVLKISNEAAIETAKLVAKTEGLPIGISAGAAVAGAIELAKRAEFFNKRIIVILPDSVERYLSTGNF